MKPEINETYCKGCNICVYICPKCVFLKGKKLSDIGYFIPSVSAPEKCFNFGKKSGRMSCELCILSCPDQAINWVQEE